MESLYWYHQPVSTALFGVGFGRKTGSGSSDSARPCLNLFVWTHLHWGIAKVKRDFPLMFYVDRCKSFAEINRTKLFATSLFAIAIAQCERPHRFDHPLKNSSHAAANPQLSPCFYSFILIIYLASLYHYFAFQKRCQWMEMTLEMIQMKKTEVSE